ncbi:putative M protein, serotype 2.1 precursor [Mariannaea sp. PMI_226]|nr:putative M protein, serotype 2.1 precursor [Mariannaea sp. PMI_226]
MSTATRKPPSGSVGRLSNADSTAPPSSPSRSSSRASTPTGGHARTRSLRTGTPVSARAAAARRDTGLSTQESDARAEAAAALEDLQQRLEKEEKLSQQYKRQADVLQSKLDEAVKESAELEEHAHEHEEQLETLTNEKREITRQMREMESIYEAERSSILKEKEEMANREEEMQSVIQRLKDSLAQRNNDDESRPSRQLSSSSSPSIDGGTFAPPSSLQRSDSRNSSKLILQKDKLIESLRLELAEAQIKLVETENQGGGRLHEVERLLMEARMANARLMEDNESYQLLLQERTLKGDFGQNDFSYMTNNSNQDALNALEGKAGGNSLADELSDATEGEVEGDRRLESELKSMREQNKALTLYINKIIERLLQHQDFESILDTSGDMKSMSTPADTNKELPPPPSDKSNGPTFLQRTRSMVVGPSKVRPRPISVIQSSTHSDHTDPDKAPSIPIGNLTRSQSTRRRPQSDQYTGAASLVSQMYRGPDGPVSPPLGTPRHSQTFFSPGSISGNPNAAARIPSSSQVSSAGNFPGMRSETSSLSGESGELSMSTPPSQSPPRSHHEKQTTSFTGGKPRPLRLVQENQDAVKDSKRASWYSGWSWGKKDEMQPQTNDPIPE